MIALACDFDQRCRCCSDPRFSPHFWSFHLTLAVFAFSSRKWIWCLQKFNHYFRVYLGIFRDRYKEFCDRFARGRGDDMVFLARRSAQKWCPRGTLRFSGQILIQNQLSLCWKKPLTYFARNLGNFNFISILVVFSSHIVFDPAATLSLIFGQGDQFVL